MHLGEGWTGAAVSTSFAALGALFGIGSLQESISMQMAMAYFWRQDGHIVNHIKTVGPRELIAEGVLRMLKTTRNSPFKKNQRLSLSSKNDWRTNKVQFVCNREIWCVGEFEKRDLLGNRRRKGREIFVPVYEKQVQLIGIEALRSTYYTRGRHQKSAYMF